MDATGLLDGLTERQAEAVTSTGGGLLSNGAKVANNASSNAGELRLLVSVRQQRSVD